MHYVMACGPSSHNLTMYFEYSLQATSITCEIADERVHHRREAKIVTIWIPKAAYSRLVQQWYRRAATALSLWTWHRPSPPNHPQQSSTPDSLRVERAVARLERMKVD